MIISKDIIWLHFPKTAGTTFNQIFQEIGQFYIDGDNQTDQYGIHIKHDSIERRENMSSWKYSGQKKFINCRRLPDWILSDFFFKKDFLNLNSDFNLCRQGVIKYALRHNGEIKPADWWVQYFKVDDVNSLRFDNLSEDLNNKLVSHIPELNYVELNVRRNSSLTKKNMLDYFSPNDIKIMYKNNPLWETWERKTYGNTYLEII